MYDKIHYKKKKKKDGEQTNKKKSLFTYIIPMYILSVYNLNYSPPSTISISDYSFVFCTTIDGGQLSVVTGELASEVTAHMSNYFLIWTQSQ